ncbi:MAG: biotin--[acetyl-CoA-carboxylase] ligase [Alphaproteobacteria bacterium]|nr:biotin--[acetyl-CoA-carboxylase] ligase [Alphaproteobacteria bacterium]
MHSQAATAAPAMTVLAQTGSTNDDAKALARLGAAEGSIVQALCQTAGRGRQGNQWMSEPGNLYMSMILRPQVSAAQSGQLSFLAAVALAQTVQALLPPTADIALKWPNDLLIDGRKAAGILLETESASGKGFIDWLVLGMGLNLRHAPTGAISLLEAGAENIDVAAARDFLAGNVLTLYRCWQQEGFSAIRSAWLERAAHLGRTIRVRLPGEDFHAVFDGIDAQGALEITMEGGAKRVIASGEVFAI